ncbi:MAG: porin family protein [Hyphomicrobiales bacterium]
MRTSSADYGAGLSNHISIKVFVFAFLFAVGSVAAPASLAQDKRSGGQSEWYASGTIGPAGLDDGGDSDTGFAISGALGKRFTSPFRGEFSISYQEAELDNSSEIYALSLFANGYYDFLIDSSLTPYVGLGFGPVFTGRERGKNDDEDTDLGFNFIGGASFEFSEAVDIVGQYRYLNTSGFVDEVHAVEVGLRYNF